MKYIETENRRKRDRVCMKKRRLSEMEQSRRAKQSFRGNEKSDVPIRVVKGPEVPGRYLPGCPKEWQDVPIQLCKIIVGSGRSQS